MNAARLTKLYIYLGQVCDMAKEILREDAGTIEPWMLHRLENIAADATSERETIEKHCKEYVE